MDATIINAPSSTKNREKKRDPNMHSTKKGNHYYFGMKIHVGVERKSRTVHSLVTTPANAEPVNGQKGTAGVDRGVVDPKTRKSKRPSKPGIALKDAESCPYSLNMG